MISGRLPRWFTNWIWARVAAPTWVRAADAKIGGTDPNDPYMLRWWIIPRNRFFNVYVHEFFHDDDDQALHDHPYMNLSIVLVGSYFEHTPKGVFERKQDSWVLRQPSEAHRISLGKATTHMSLFVTGPRVRNWGFHCPKGWVRWQDFADPKNSGIVGKGCDQ